MVVASLRNREERWAIDYENAALTIQNTDLNLLDRNSFGK